MTRIILVRHGHVEGIDPERFRGRTDVPLSELGARQAALTARRIVEAWRFFTEVYCSPLGRCVETAQAIAAPTGRHVIPLEGLNDLDYGEWRWKTLDEVRTGSPTLLQTWLETPDIVRFPEGESLADLQARAVGALQDICNLHPHETVVLVGHDSVNRTILLQLLGMPLSSYWRLVQSPCAINEVEIDGGRIRVLRMNETGHIKGLKL